MESKSFRNNPTFKIANLFEYRKYPNCRLIFKYLDKYYKMGPRGIKGLLAMKEQQKYWQNTVIINQRDIDNFLLEVEAKNSVAEVDDVREKIALRQKRVELSEVQLNEKVSSWKDVALLKKELREKQRELNEKQGRLDMFGKILEEK